MSGTATPIFPQAVKNWAAQILPADTTTKITLLTGGTNGSKLETLTVSSTDTSARDLLLWLTSGGTDYLLTTVSIPASSGSTNALPAVDMLRSAQIPGLSFDANGNRIMYVANGAVLKMSVGVTVTAAKAVQAFGCGGDF